MRISYKIDNLKKFEITKFEILLRGSKASIEVISNYEVIQIDVLNSELENRFKLRHFGLFPPSISNFPSLKK